MGLLSKLKQKQEEKAEETKGIVENFMTLIRVYYQSVMAVNLGITNIRMLPDITMYKHVYKVQTQGGRLGVAEKSHSRKTLMQNYGLSEKFFSEIDASIKKNCKNVNGVNPYMVMFAGFSNDLFMLTGNLMKWKFGIPKIFKKLIFNTVKQTVHQILTKTNWKKDDVIPVARNIRAYKEKLDYSEEWMVEYVYHVIMLSKQDKKK